ncbi:unnamed protein product, partial [Aphanomyces euteiches]
MLESVIHFSTCQDMSFSKASIAFLLNNDIVVAYEPPLARRCKTDGCNNYVASKGLCIRHG